MPSCMVWLPAVPGDIHPKRRLRCSKRGCEEAAEGAEAEEIQGRGLRGDPPRGSTVAFNPLGRLELRLDFLELDQRAVESLGCRNSTGRPCAPVLGLPSPSTRAPRLGQRLRRAHDIGHLKAEVMDAARGVPLEEPAIGEFSPSGVISSILVLSSMTKTTVTPCSAGRADDAPPPRAGRGIRGGLRKVRHGDGDVVERPIICWKASLDLVEHRERRLQHVGAGAEDLGHPGRTQELVVLLGMTPPTITVTSASPRRLSSAISSGTSVLWPAASEDTPTASTFISSTWPATSGAVSNNPPMCTSKPRSAKAEAMTLAPRSWPSCPSWQ